MHVQRIMCPVDFSESSMAALDNTASLALQLGAQLLIVYVDEHPMHKGAASSSLAQELSDRRNQLEEMVPRGAGIMFEHHLLCGKAAEEIPRFARNNNVDLVVMVRHDAHRRFHLRHDGLCHVALQHCSCLVMTITYAPAHISWAC